MDWQLLLVAVAIVALDLLLTVPFHIVYALIVNIEYGFYESSVNVSVTVTYNSIHCHTILAITHIGNACLHVCRKEVWRR